MPPRATSRCCAGPPALRKEARGHGCDDGEGHDRPGCEGEDLKDSGIAPVSLQEREGGGDADGVAVGGDVVARGGIDPRSKSLKNLEPPFWARSTSTISADPTGRF